jgi:hypothetical protein
MFFLSYGYIFLDNIIIEKIYTNEYKTSIVLIMMIFMYSLQITECML